MAYIDVAIPGALGLLILVWPRFVFRGSRVSPDEARLRLVRGAGLALVVVAAAYLGIRLAGS